jgi:hypothetical protein
LQHTIHVLAICRFASFLPLLAVDNIIYILIEFYHKTFVRATRKLGFAALMAERGKFAVLIWLHHQKEGNGNVWRQGKQELLLVPSKIILRRKVCG